MLAAQPTPIIPQAAKPFPGSLAEKIPAQAAKNAIPWIVIGIGIVAGIGGMWYYYKNLR